MPGAADATVLIFDHAIRTGGEVLQSDDERYAQANPYGAGVHSDATVRSGHTRAKDQILGSNETEVKYGRLPASWGDVRPGREAQRRFFRPETIDHQSPEGEGGDHMIVNGKGETMSCVLNRCSSSGKRCHQCGGRSSGR